MSNNFIAILVYFLTTPHALAAGTYFRTICQDPRDTIVSRPLCTRAKLACPVGSSLTEVRAICESDQIKDLTWAQIQNVAWNTLFVSRSLTKVPWACSVGSFKSKTEGVHNITSAVGTGKQGISFGCLGDRTKGATSGRPLDPSCQILVEYHCE